MLNRERRKAEIAQVLSETATDQYQLPGTTGHTAMSGPGCALRSGRGNRVWSRLAVRRWALDRRRLLWPQYVYPHAVRQAIRGIDNHLIRLG